MKFLQRYLSISYEIFESKLHMKEWRFLMGGEKVI